MRSRKSIASMSLSMLDLLSCTLGAVIILSVIMSSMVKIKAATEQEVFIAIYCEIYTEASIEIGTRKFLNDSDLNINLILPNNREMYLDHKKFKFKQKVPEYHKLYIEKSRFYSQRITSDIQNEKKRATAFIYAIFDSVDFGNNGLYRLKISMKTKGRQPSKIDEQKSIYKKCTIYFPSKGKIIMKNYNEEVKIAYLKSQKEKLFDIEFITTL